LEKEKLVRLKEILCSYKGKHNIYLHFSNKGGEETIIRSKSIKVGFTDSLISEVEDLLGSKSLWLSED